MSRVHCTISGQPTDDPVLSPISGCIFDRSVITKYLEEFGSDPVTESELKVNELIPVKLHQHVSETLRPNTTSIPALLKALQNEWEVNAIYTYRIRKELQRARTELSHSLYRNDAALRTITRLTQQLSATRNALATLNVPDPTSVGAGAADTTDETDVAMDEALTAKITTKHDEMSAQRRQRRKEAPEEQAKSDDVAEKFQVKTENRNLHDSSPPGILSLDVRGNITATGGADKKVVLYNLESDTVESTFTGHRKKVLSVVLLPDQETVISGSADTQIRTWKKGTEEAVSVYKQHNGAITGVDLHPLGTHFVSVSQDGLWSFSDIPSGKPVFTRNMYALLPAPETKNAYSFGSARIHPDGVLIGMGTQSGTLYVWDIREHNTAAGEFPDHGSLITSIAFSENGYHLAAGTASGVVKLWDLRKLNCFKTVELASLAEVKSLNFDNHGSYLLTGASTNAKIFSVKPWNELASFEHDDIVTGVKFGEFARSFTTTSMDRKLRHFSID